MPETELALEVRDLSLLPGTEPISENIERQEILGLAGLDGHGQAMFLESLAGIHQSASGTVKAQTSSELVHIKSLKDAARAGVGYMPSDRKKNGIFPGLSVQDNFSLGNLARFSRFGWLAKSRADKALDAYRDDLSMAYAHRNIPITSLSGGNQQKVLLARAMARNPRVMLLNDPTRGVDIQTRQTLYGYFRQAVETKGMTLVVLSTELDEIIELCDRVIVFRDFNVAARLQKADLTVDALMSAMFGQNRQAAQ